MLITEIGRKEKEKAKETGLPIKKQSRLKTSLNHQIKEEEELSTIKEEGKGKTKRKFSASTVKNEVAMPLNVGMAKGSRPRTVKRRLMWLKMKFLMRILFCWLQPVMELPIQKLDI